MLSVTAAIPFIVHPIDNAIHAVMNMTLRPAMRKYVCSSGQGSLAGLQMCGEEECIPPGVGEARALFALLVLCIHFYREHSH